MNRAEELLLRCKVKLGVKTDYQLAKALEMHSGLISDYTKGKRLPTTYACVKIAEVLELDPLELIAEFEELSAKNETEKKFWADFKSRVRHPLRVLTMALFCTLTLLIGSGDSKNASAFFRRRNYA